MEQHIVDLKNRIEELKDVIREHANVLNVCKGKFSPYLDKEIENLRLLRVNTLQRTKPENIISY